MPEAGTAGALPPLRALRDPTAELQLELISSGASGEQAEAYASVALVLESGMVGGVAVAMLLRSLLPVEHGGHRRYIALVSPRAPLCPISKLQTPTP
jgi:hypothetical protein